MARAYNPKPTWCFQHGVPIPCEECGKPCPVCGGNGKHPDPMADLYWCYRCGGSGKFGEGHGGRLIAAEAMKC